MSNDIDIAMRLEQHVRLDADKPATTIGLTTLPTELLLHITTFLDNDSWSLLAFAWKRFLVEFAQTMDPNNQVRRRLVAQCAHRAYFADLVSWRMHRRAIYDLSVGARRGWVRASVPDLADMHFVLRASAPFFLAADAFAALDSYRHDHMHHVIHISAGLMTRELLHLVRTVEPAIHHKLQSKKLSFQASFSCVGNERLWTYLGNELPPGNVRSELCQLLDLLHAPVASLSAAYSSETAEVGRQHRLFRMQGMHIFAGMDQALIDTLSPHFEQGQQSEQGIRRLVMLKQFLVTAPEIASLFRVLQKYRSLECAVWDLSDADRGMLGETARFLEQNTTMKSFEVIFDQYKTDDQEYGLFGRALFQNSTLRHVGIQAPKCNGRMTQALLSAFAVGTASQLTRLTIDEGCLTDRGTEQVLRLLATNKTLRRLSVWVGYRGMKGLAAFLRANTVVKKLIIKPWLRDIPARPEDGLLEFKQQHPTAELDLLFEALRQNKTLQVLIMKGFATKPRHTEALTSMIRENTALRVLNMERLCERQPPRPNEDDEEDDEEEDDDEEQDGDEEEDDDEEEDSDDEDEEDDDEEEFDQADTWEEDPASVPEIIDAVQQNTNLQVCVFRWPGRQDWVMRRPIAKFNRKDVDLETETTRDDFWGTSSDDEYY